MDGVSGVERRGRDNINKIKQEEQRNGWPPMKNAVEWLDVRGRMRLRKEGKIAVPEEEP